MSTFVLLTITGLGLGAMYFLIASGLSLIYGLMGVLNFAHGAFLTVGAYATWWMSTHVGGGAGTQLLVGAVFGLAVGAVLAALVELVLIRPLYRRPIEQVLVTVGLALVLGALVEAIWGFDARPFPVPAWMIDTTTILGAHDPERPLRRDRGRRARPRRPDRLPALHALRADHPRRRREPRDGDRARDRRAQGVHARLRARRRSPRRSPACSPASTSASSTRAAARRC